MRFHPLCFMYTIIFSSFNLFGENKNWKIVTEDRQIAYRVYTENHSQSHAVFIQVWKLKARTNWNTLPQREVLKAKSSAVVSLYSTDTVCDISTYECVLFSMMDVAKSSDRWLAGWKLRHAIGFPINCRTVFSSTRGRKTLLQIQIVSKFQIFCQII